MKEQQNLFEEVAVVASFSNPEKEYTVKKNIETGVVSCSCPAWLYQRKPLADRTCKHIKALTA